MKPCPEYEQELAACAALSKEPSLGLASHLLQCGRCRGAFAELQAVAALHTHTAAHLPSARVRPELDSWFANSLARRSERASPVARHGCGSAGFQPAVSPTSSRLRAKEDADWKSAIQQTGSLRYYGKQPDRHGSEKSAVDARFAVVRLRAFVLCGMALVAIVLLGLFFGSRESRATKSSGPLVAHLPAVRVADARAPTWQSFRQELSTDDPSVDRTYRRLGAVVSQYRLKDVYFEAN